MICASCNPYPDYVLNMGLLLEVAPYNFSLHWDGQGRVLCRFSVGGFLIYNMVHLLYITWRSLRLAL